MQLSIIHFYLSIFWQEVLPLCRGYSKLILLYTSVTLWAASVSVCVGASQRISLSTLARNPHKGLGCEISCETGSGRGKEDAREVSWQRIPEEDSRQKGAEGTSRQNRSVREMKAGQKREKNRSQKDDCRLTEARLTYARKWVSIPSGFVEVSRKYTPMIACKCTESSTKVSQTSLLLRLELTQARFCSFVHFFHPLGCVLCVRKEMCNVPGRR